MFPVDVWMYGQCMDQVWSMQYMGALSLTRVHCALQLSMSNSSALASTPLLAALMHVCTLHSFVNALSNVFPLHWWTSLLLGKSLGVKFPFSHLWTGRYSATVNAQRHWWPKPLWSWTRKTGMLSNCQDSGHWPGKPLLKEREDPSANTRDHIIDDNEAFL